MQDYVTAYSPFRITDNGEHRLSFEYGRYKKSFAAVWSGPEGVAPGGTVSLLFDRNPGDPPAVMNLAAGGIGSSGNTFDGWNGPHPQEGNRGQFWGVAGWNNGTSCGSASRSAKLARSGAYTHNGCRGRARSRASR